MSIEIELPSYITQTPERAAIIPTRLQAQTETPSLRSIQHNKPLRSLQPLTPEQLKLARRNRGLELEQRAQKREWREQRRERARQAQRRELDQRVPTIPTEQQASDGTFYTTWTSNEPQRQQVGQALEEWDPQVQARELEWWVQQAQREPTAPTGQRAQTEAPPHMQSNELQIPQSGQGLDKLQRMNLQEFMELDDQELERLEELEQRTAPSRQAGGFWEEQVYDYNTVVNNYYNNLWGRI